MISTLKRVSDTYNWFIPERAEIKMVKISHAKFIDVVKLYILWGLCAFFSSSTYCDDNCIVICVIIERLSSL